VEIACHNIRDFSGNKHNKVDDTPYGGGMGMVMSAAPIYNCFMSLYDSETEAKPHLVYMTPKGPTFTQKKAVELSKYDRVVLLCGHYEGVDQRVIDAIVDEEISVGDYVLTGGELPALTVADAVCRMLPGVLADDICFTEESHFAGLLEYPQYTKPEIWNDMQVPEVLLSGHHANIAKWRRERAIEETYRRRPEMLSEAELSKKEKIFLEDLKKSK
ncbi:MAG: tRNA (guanosine(37)-N1)-methyltransferase TrmD, partial [Clostridia bacterium]|nr:tRNA (guanosine(37)-N1)-methyltransferase TrmD [Clostridia bacterium]